MSHVPVMLREVIQHLAPRDEEAILDATFGGGGYTTAILEAARCTVWAIDRDPDAIARGAAIAARYPGRLHLLPGRFGDMVALLAAHGVGALDGIVLDLGVSSFQFDDPGRGFSFRVRRRAADDLRHLAQLDQPVALYDALRTEGDLQLAPFVLEI